MAGVLQRSAMAIVVGAASALTVACGGGSSSATSTPRPTPASCPSASGTSASTASYTMSLNVGPVENMYTQQQIESMHPSSGEVMLGGMMSNAMGANARHVEVHICSKQTNTVVSNANPTISIKDTTTGAAPQSVPISVMQGVKEGPSDLHYGNNVDLAPGHSYDVTVALNGETATMTFTNS